jgi:hypothetical protein
MEVILTELLAALAMAKDIVDINIAAGIAEEQLRSALLKLEAQESQLI